MAAFIMSSYSYNLYKSLPLLGKGSICMEKFDRKQGAVHMP